MSDNYREEGVEGKGGGEGDMLGLTEEEERADRLAEV